VISIGLIVGCGLGPLSGIVLLSSLVLKTDENCLFKIFAFERKVTLQDTVSSKVPPKKNVEKHIKIMSRTSSTQIYQAIPKDSGASLKVNVVNQQAYPPERL
jgi:hypothetical protein